MKLVRINMSSKSITYEEVKKEYNLFGGRGLIAKILNDEVDPRCDALGEENKLIICPGLLTGTMAPCSGRISIGGKSPLTGTIKEANAGGTAAQMLSKLGIKGIILEDKPVKDDWFILRISRQGSKLIDGNKYKGMNNYRLSEELRRDFGNKVGIISIGGAGERGYRNSTIQVTDTLGRPSRSAARGGLGAVMGSKRIKAIVLDIRGPSNIDYIDKEIFSKAAKNYVKGIRSNPVSGGAMPAMGTAVLVNVVNAMGALPTRNYSSGSFERAEDISGENLVRIQKQRGGKTGHICHPGCVIGCSNIYNDENGDYLTSGFEYETIGLNGSNCGIASLDTIGKIDRLCDDFGIDTMDTGCTIAVCMEAGKIEFGDEKGALSLIQEMIDGTEFGKILGQGTEYTGKKLGVKRIPTVKGQSLAAYDPRSLKGTGVTYATSPMGADHTAGNTLGNQAVDPYNKKGQVELSTTAQVGMCTFDNLGMCIFSGFCTEEAENVEYLLEMMAGKFGGKWTPDELFGIGVQTLALEKTFNKEAGFTSKDDKLPQFMYDEPLTPQDTVFDITEEEMSKAISF